MYPLTLPILYEYEPLGSLKLMVFAVDVSVAPFNVTDQVVPDDNPLSVNVTVYVTSLNVIATEILTPLTVN